MRPGQNQQFQKKAANLEKFFASELETREVQQEELPFKRYQDYFGDKRTGAAKYQPGYRQYDK